MPEIGARGPRRPPPAARGAAARGAAPASVPNSDVPEGWDGRVRPTVAHIGHRTCHNPKSARETADGPRCLSLRELSCDVTAYRP